MKESISEEKKEKNTGIFLGIFTVQIICTVVLIALVLIIKNFSPKKSEKIKEWYEKNLLDETSVSEVLDTEGTDEI